MPPKRRRPSHTTVVAYLSLFLVISGGAAYAAGHLGKNSVGSKQLKKNSVTAAKLKNNAVTTKKIKNKAVTNAKLANGAVTGGKIAAGAVGSAQLAPNAVGSGQIGANAVGNSQTELVKVFKGGTVAAGADEASAQRLELGSVGPFRFYGKCFKNGSGRIQEKTYIELTSGTATLGSEDGAEMPLETTKQQYLTPATPESERAMEDDAEAAAGQVDAQTNDEEFQAFASDGSSITGLIGGAAAKQGEPPIGNGPLPPGDSCLVGAIAVFGS